MQRRNLGKFAVWGVLILVVVSMVAVLVFVVAAPDGNVRIAAVPTSVLPLGTKVPPTPTEVPTATSTPAPTATPEPSPTPTSAPTQTAAPPTPTAVPPTPTAVPTATPIPDLGIIPERLRIPAIGVDAKVEHVGKTADGSMDVPKNVWDVAWYDLGYKPGNPGNAVIAGHLDGYNIPAAVFINLRMLKPGNKIYLTDVGGKEMIFEVFESQVINSDATAQDLTKIFGSATEPHLNLITCNGTWDVAHQNYNQRLIIYSRQVSS